MPSEGGHQNIYFYLLSSGWLYKLAFTLLCNATYILQNKSRLLYYDWFKILFSNISSIGNVITFNFPDNPQVVVVFWILVNMHAELNVNMKMSDHIRNVNIILNKMVTGSSMQEKATLSPLLPPCQKYYIYSHHCILRRSNIPPLACRSASCSFFS